MISNLFRILFATTLALAGVIALVGHATHGQPDTKKVHTADKMTRR